MVKEGAPDSFEVDFDEDDDGRFPVCESCCNTTACNNGGSCGVAGLTCLIQFICMVLTYIFNVCYNQTYNMF